MKLRKTWCAIAVASLALCGIPGVALAEESSDSPAVTATDTGSTDAETGASDPSPSAAPTQPDPEPATDPPATTDPPKPDPEPASTTGSPGGGTDAGTDHAGGSGHGTPTDSGHSSPSTTPEKSGGSGAGSTSGTDSGSGSGTPTTSGSTGAGTTGTSEPTTGGASTSPQPGSTGDKATGTTGGQDATPPTSTAGPTGASTAGPTGASTDGSGGASTNGPTDASTAGPTGASTAGPGGVAVSATATPGATAAEIGRLVRPAAVEPTQTSGVGPVVTSTDPAGVDAVTPQCAGEASVVSLKLTGQVADIAFSIDGVRYPAVLSGATATVSLPANLTAGAHAYAWTVRDPDGEQTHGSGSLTLTSCSTTVPNNEITLAVSGMITRCPVGTLNASAVFTSNDPQQYHAALTPAVKDAAAGVFMYQPPAGSTYASFVIDLSKLTDGVTYTVSYSLLSKATGRVDKSMTLKIDAAQCKWPTTGNASAKTTCDANGRASVALFLTNPTAALEAKASLSEGGNAVTNSLAAGRSAYFFLGQSGPDLDGGTITLEMNRSTVPSWSTITIPYEGIHCTPVTPEEPTFTASQNTSTCPVYTPGDATIAIPDVTGVDYMIEGEVITGTYVIPAADLSKTVTVAAVARKGYTLAEKTDGWTWTFQADPPDTCPMVCGVGITLGNPVVTAPRTTVVAGEVTVTGTVTVDAGYEVPEGTVEVTLTDSKGGTATATGAIDTAAGTWTATVDASKLADGEATITAAVSYEWGTQTCGPEPLTGPTITLDNTAPTVVPKPASGKTYCNKGTLDASAVFTDQNPDRYYITLIPVDAVNKAKAYQGNLPAGAYTADYTVDLSVLADGTYRIQYSAVDKAGNKMKDAFVTFTVDSTQCSWPTAGDVSVRSQCDANGRAAVAVYVKGNPTPAFAGRLYLPGALGSSDNHVTEAGANGYYFASAAGPDLDAGVARLAMYRAGVPSYSELSLPYKAVKCATPVEPTVDPSTNDTCPVWAPTDATLTFEATDRVQYLVDGKKITGDTYTVPAADLPTSVTVTAEAQDGYTLTPGTWSWAIDLTAPDPCPEICGVGVTFGDPAVSGPKDAVATTSEGTVVARSVKVTGTIEADAGRTTPEATITVTAADAAGHTATATATTAAGDASWSVDLDTTGLADGEATISTTVTYTIAGGEACTPEVSDIHVIVDNTDPTVKAPESGATYCNTGTLDASAVFTDEHPTRYYIALLDATGTRLDAAAVNNTAATPLPAGEYTMAYPVDLSTLADGSYTLQYSALDVVNNKMADVKVTFTVDATQCTWPTSTDVKVRSQCDANGRAAVALYVTKNTGPDLFGQLFLPGGLGRSDRHATAGGEAGYYFASASGPDLEAGEVRFAMDRPLVPSSQELTVPFEAVHCTPVTPADPTPVPSVNTGTCPVHTPGDASITIPTTAGVDYRIDGVTVSGSYVVRAADLPATVTVTAVARKGWTLAEKEEGWTWTFDLALPEKCGSVELVRVTPVDPTVAQSVNTDTCPVWEPSDAVITLPTTAGVDYRVDGATVSGQYTVAAADLPATVTVTAAAQEGYVLTDPSWSVSLDLVKAEECEPVTTPPTTPATEPPTTPPTTEPPTTPPTTPVTPTATQTQAVPVTTSPAPDATDTEVAPIPGDSESPAGVSAPTGALPYTGSNLGVPIGLAAGLILLGALAALLRRRSAAHS